MDYKELKAKPVAEQQRLLQESRQQLQELRFKVANSQLKNIREIRLVRQTIARLLMLTRQRRSVSAAAGVPGAKEQL